LPDGKKFGAMSTNLKVLDSTLPTDAFIEVSRRFGVSFGWLALV